MRHSRLAALAAAAFAAAAIVPATVQAADKPVPCVGETADPAGDAFVGFAGESTPIPAESNQDITSMFFRNDGKKVTANLRIADLNKTVPPGGQGVVYRLFYTFGEVEQFIDVEVTPSGEVTYSYGHFEDLPVGDGDTAGQFFEGKDGVISVTVPTGAGGRPGTSLTAIRWWASTSTRVVLMQSDIVPDTGEVTYNGAKCPDAGGDPPAQTTTPPPSPGPTPPTPAPQPTAPANQKAVTIKASKVAKAKTASRKKALALTLRASESLSAVTVKLKKGAKVLGSIKLSSLGTKGQKLSIKFKGRRLKKGRYKISVTGKRAIGTDAAANTTIKVK